VNSFILMIVGGVALTYISMRLCIWGMDGGSTWRICACIYGALLFAAGQVLNITALFNALLRVLS
jgi:hypothetical protein